MGGCQPGESYGEKPPKDRPYDRFSPRVPVVGPIFRRLLAPHGPVPYTSTPIGSQHRYPRPPAQTSCFSAAVYATMLLHKAINDQHYQIVNYIQLTGVTPITQPRWQDAAEIRSHASIRNADMR